MQARAAGHDTPLNPLLAAAAGVAAGCIDQPAALQRITKGAA
jgi:hypothetical protein